MSYKTGGCKTKYVYEYGYERNEYIIYCALESVSDIESYKMFNEQGEEVPIEFSCIDGLSKGKYSIIDCLFVLRHHGPGRYSFSEFESDDVVVEEMTREEMDKIFG